MYMKTFLFAYRWLITSTYVYQSNGHNAVVWFAFKSTLTLRQSILLPRLYKCNKFNFLIRSIDMMLYGLRTTQIYNFWTDIIFSLPLKNKMSFTFKKNTHPRFVCTCHKYSSEPRYLRLLFCNVRISYSRSFTLDHTIKSFVNKYFMRMSKL